MAFDYSVDVCKSLAGKFDELELHRPMRVGHYDAGAELSYEVSAVDNDDDAIVRLSIEKFVGGGFAGQVYKVKILSINSENATFGGLVEGGVYALKILIPPSGFSNLFRNLLYAVGFQGPFQLQVNPAAARSGAIWQKFIRLAANTRFADEGAVNDVHGLFVDDVLGSCGEISDWVEGRTWRLEVDENLDTLKKWRRGKDVDPEKLGSAEYRAKHEFMHKFVKLLHEMGAHEFARQYEWSTCKSQPNCLKRTSSEDDPEKGLTAVDFRAGLTLLPFLPMSPGDFGLIVKGIARGSLVQFDRGNIVKLEAFIASHRDDFEGTEDMLEDLRQCEKTYRNSVPDITHNGLRLLYSRQLWGTILSNSVRGWRIRNQIDDIGQSRLWSSRIATFFAYFIGIIPFFGRFMRRCEWNEAYRRHYGSLFNPIYFSKAVEGLMIEKSIGWHRAGRMTAEKTEKVSQCMFNLFIHLIFSILPAGLHRFMTDFAYFKSKLSYIFVRPFRLYFSKTKREEWLRDMVVEGKRKHILSDDDAETILGQIDEPYIQKYLVSLVVHLMTLPVTQIVGLIIALINWQARDLPWDQAWKQGAIIMGALQVVPLSPGSFCRGIYTTYMAIRDRNFKDYNVALFLSYFKYIGYLAFPIQMAYRYPALARFMAAHWATDAVHVVPVFGERGALLEHWVYRLFYNWPLTLRRKMSSRKEFRSKLSPRYWHVGLAVVAGAMIFGFTERSVYSSTLVLPGLMDIRYLAFLVPFAVGVVITIGAGGMLLWKRIVSACLGGAMIGVLYAALTSLIVRSTGDYFFEDPPSMMGVFMSVIVWRVFAFTIFAVIGAIITELVLPDPVLIDVHRKVSLE